MSPRPPAPRAGPAAAAIAACLALFGCGGGAGRVEVAGEVTFDGKPVPAGRIYFNPDVANKNDGPQGFADIRDGKFDTRQGGRGAYGGPTVVVIQGYAAGKDGAPGSVGPRLFRDYQLAIDLTKEASNQRFDVPASAARGLAKNPAGRRGP